jgi:DNA-binding SARP family transcriptional activator/TolB-like protein/Tfp pilus assembly protein PilF
MGRVVGETVEMPAEPALVIRLLGPASVRRGEVEVPLPRSRKVRALLAYLALSPQAVSRTRLCDLFWDVPNDPRGELRWSLSKLRGILDEPSRARVTTAGDLVTLDLSGVTVDALEIDRGLQDGLLPARLSGIARLFGGDLLEGVELDGAPEASGWLTAQRNRYHAMHVQVLQALALAAAHPDERFRRLEAWLQVAPFDVSAHQVMLEMLARAGRLRAGDEYLAATVRSFEAEGVEWSTLRDSWRARRAAAMTATAVTIVDPRASDPAQAPRARRAVAVMPFEDRSGRAPGEGRFADGLTEDIIMQLAKLRALFVIARGSVFALRDRGVAPEEAARLLHVEYVVTGSIRRDGASRCVVAVELSRSSDGRIVWTDAFDGVVDETLSMLDAVVHRIVAAIAEEIEAAECRAALLKPPSSLDAWEAYHRGLWHMYRFNSADNHQAETFFRAAIERDPVFARAHAGLSFTHFQNAFLDLTPDRARQIDLAFETAAQSLAADGHDPAAHWAMGRALWLSGSQDESLAELARSTDLSPNFALGHYTIGFVQAQMGDPRIAIEATNHSRELSPFDPLQFAMLATRAIAHVRLQERDEAADWATKATARPNAHAHILAIAAECLALAERKDEARRYVGRIRERLPAYSVEDFLRAFRFAPDVARLFRFGARSIGFDR